MSLIDVYLSGKKEHARRLKTSGMLNNSIGLSEKYLSEWIYWIKLKKLDLNKIKEV